MDPMRLIVSDGDGCVIAQILNDSRLSSLGSGPWSVEMLRQRIRVVCSDHPEAHTLLVALASMDDRLGRRDSRELVHVRRAAVRDRSMPRVLRSQVPRPVDPGT